MRQYGLHGFLAFSVFLNLILFTTRPGPANKVTAELKGNFEQLARDVTTQLLDTSYITYASSTQKLLTTGELHQVMIDKLRQSQLLPRSAEEMKATERTLRDEKVVAAVRIDSVSTGDPVGQQGYVPVDVQGVVATHSASGADEKQFHLRYFMGLVAAPSGQAGSDVNSHSRYAAMSGGGQQATVPIIVDYQEVGPAG